jgi:hypothetical protein
MDHLYLHSLTLPLFSDARLANAARTRENRVLSREEAVTPEDEARIRELPGLIATERGPEKIKLFAGRTGDFRHTNEVSTPYSIAEVAALMHLSPRVVTQLFEHEPGVITYEIPNPRRKRASYRTIRIPRHVYERVVRRCTVR